jgi:hypothetical protein
MISYKVEIYDSEDLRNWALNNGWSIDWQIEKIDELDLWDEVYDLIEEIYNNTLKDFGELDSETELNDMLRFGLDDMRFFEQYEDDDDDDDDEDEDD